MHKRCVLTFFIWVVAVLNPVWAETIQGVVVGVADGDTITVLDDSHIQRKVRLAGIDAPEKGQDFGQGAKQNLSAMAHGKHVTVEGHKIDRYGRFVGKVMVGEIDVNLHQIEMGFAWVYRAYESELAVSDRVAYNAAENEAKAAKRGVWAMSQPVPPWQFRAGRAAGPAARPADFR
jgi:endonuclease YncB( thermonuclease family)